MVVWVINVGGLGTNIVKRQELQFPVRTYAAEWWDVLVCKWNVPRGKQQNVYLHFLHLECRPARTHSSLGVHFEGCLYIKSRYACFCVPIGSPSRGRDVTVYVLNILTDRACPLFVFCSCVCFCVYGPFKCISFNKFSQEISAFSLCSSGLTLPYWSFQLISLYKSLPQPWYNPLWLTGLKALTI